LLAPTILGIIDYLLTIARWIIIIQAILSILIAFNVINTHNNFVRSLHTGLDQITEPLYRPFRRILPSGGGIDWSPFVVLILITILQSFILPAIAGSIAGPASPSPY
jgi:YggT family protein